MHTRLIPLSALAVALTVAASVAAAPRSTAESRGTQLRAAPATAQSGTVLARLRTADGHHFDFVQEGRDVGIAETSRNGRPSKLLAMVEGQQASPLEVYHALGGRLAAAPMALHASHERFVRLHGRADGNVRTLAVAPVAKSSVTEDYDPGACDYNASVTPGNSTYTRDWYWLLGRFKDFTAQQTYQATHLNGTAGKYWYAGTTGARWLGACNGNYIYGFPNFEFRAQYRGSSGSWVTAYSQQLAPEFSVRYYSFSSPENWRVHLREMGYNVFLNREFAVAVAGNEPLGIGF